MVCFAVPGSTIRQLSSLNTTFANTFRPLQRWTRPCWRCSSRLRTEPKLGKSRRRLQMLSTQIHLVSRPQGQVGQENFKTVEVPLQELGSNEVRVRYEVISVGPNMRGRMNEGKSYISPLQLNPVMEGGAVGRVVESTAPQLPVGTLVQHMLGWRDVAQGPAKAFRAI